MLYGWSVICVVVALAALGADHDKAAIMEQMIGTRIELSSPNFVGEARPVGARPSCIVPGTLEIAS